MFIWWSVKLRHIHNRPKLEISYLTIGFVGSAQNYHLIKFKDGYIHFGY